MILKRIIPVAGEEGPQHKPPRNEEATIEVKADSPETAELKQSLGVEKGKGRGEKRPTPMCSTLPIPEPYPGYNAKHDGRWRASGGPERERLSRAHDEGRAQRVEELKEIEELCNKRKQEIQDLNELVKDNSLMQNLKDVCNHFNDMQQLDVLTRLLSVFRPYQSVLPLLDEHGAAGILEMIVREHHLDTNVIIGMFKDLPKEVSWPHEAEDEQRDVRDSPPQYADFNWSQPPLPEAQQRRGRASSSHLRERSRSRDASPREVSPRRDKNSRHRSERTPSREREVRPPNEVRERGRSRIRSRSRRVVMRPKGKGKGKDKGKTTGKGKM